MRYCLGCPGMGVGTGFSARESLCGFGWMKGARVVVVEPI